MTRIYVQRGSSAASGSSQNTNSNPNPNRAGSSSVRPEQVTQVQSVTKDEESGEEEPGLVVADDVLEYAGSSNRAKGDDPLMESLHFEENDTHTPLGNEVLVDLPGKDVKEEVEGLQESRERPVIEKEGLCEDNPVVSGGGGSSPPPPPVPPPKPSSTNLNSRRSASGSPNAVNVGSPRRGSAWPVVVSARTSPAESRPSSPRAHSESEGYNSADEQNPCYVSSYDDVERERQFEIDIRRVKGFEVKRMSEDGNCLFRAVADQVYGDSELYDLVRQMSVDYMERERDHFSQFITEGFTSYCKRKRRDKVYGNNVEIQAMCEMYNRPIHIYSYSTEPINTFHGSYDTDTPPVRLSFHHGNHYNSLVDPRRPTIGAGLGFSSLRGTNVDKDQVKAAIKSQQDQQIDNALLAEGRFYSDLELTEKEIELAVMEASRAEYLAGGTFKQQLGNRESSTSTAEPSSSGARSSGSDPKMESGKGNNSNLSSSMNMLLSMGFSYLQAIEAYSIFGDDVDSMICYLLETGSSSRRKGKATE
ncbi:putative ubiquitinyl hydrolase 1 [Medicago truncatula]|uniref:OTU-like cysteine protease n=1 Tax=Medicago truncatula TaxID=3880 RepID=G7IHG3_MEDTR|nr:OVARIAN TUMOR DOMAIN-containing deubiquitinating enzyme 6 [Medicago truncatula]XP_024632390.1 OVARIAN TUMOR DOMAIN-containing deubiquitinating enzyme 6 [Medicago truncatula]XP_024632392.1 OVARIAN TUMOR DOMAIN-containing deubiquitinating enzyme 6 [Medicago truncatula]AES67101.2 OTU-like cysteine protease [Medicago truncatula]RHN75478.1 putative ubiquitinyl hydrolase 1 [Medicago truncatula]